MGTMWSEEVEGHVYLDFFPRVSLLVWTRPNVLLHPSWWCYVLFPALPLSLFSSLTHPHPHFVLLSFITVHKQTRRAPACQPSLCLSDYTRPEIWLGECTLHFSVPATIPGAVSDSFSQLIDFLFLFSFFVFYERRLFSCDSVLNEEVVKKEVISF